MWWLGYSAHPYIAVHAKGGGLLCRICNNQSSESQVQDENADVYI